MVKKILSGLSILFCLFIIITISTVFFGYQYYNVISDSMYPTIPKYSLVYVKKIEVEDVYSLENKIIAFMENEKPTMHRVVGFEGETIITRGDRNSESSIERVQKEDVIGVVVFSIPLVGILFDSIYPPLIFLLVLMMYFIIERLIKELKK